VLYCGSIRAVYEISQSRVLLLHLKRYHELDPEHRCHVNSKADNQFDVPKYQVQIFDRLNATWALRSNGSIPVGFEHYIWVILIKKTVSRETAKKTHSLCI